MAHWPAHTAATPLALLALLVSVGGPPLGSPATVSADGSPGAWSHCSAVPDVADPGGVRGLFVAGANQTNNPSLAAAILNYLPSDPTICGAKLVIPWSAIDGGPGANPQYDWSFVDQAAAPWEAAGKIVNLIVWGTDEKASQGMGGTPATPAYVLATTDTVSCTNDDPIPLYWDPGYQQPWRAFQAALVAHVAGDSNIGYLRFGLGTGGEDFPVDGFNQGACWQAWVAKGLTAARWLELSISQIDYEASLGSDHPLNISVNSFPGAPKLPGQVAAEAVKYGIGFGTQGMTATQIGLATSRPGACSGDWCQLFQTWAGRVPLEVQPYSPTTPAGGGPTGALPPLLAYVITQAHAQVIELYPEEWLVADDPKWPSYALFHDDYTQALAHAAAAVGGAGGG